MAYNDLSWTIEISSWKSKSKVMFDKQGVVHHEFVTARQNVNRPLYVQVLKRFRKAIQRKVPKKGRAMVTASRQCSHPHIHTCADMTYRKEHSSPPPSFLLTGFCTIGLLSIVLQDQNGPHMQMF